MIMRDYSSLHPVWRVIDQPKALLPPPKFDVRVKIDPRRNAK